jgi:hypothetical protein
MLELGLVLVLVLVLVRVLAWCWPRALLSWCSCGRCPRAPTALSELSAHSHRPDILFLLHCIIPIFTIVAAIAVPRC